MSIRLHVGALPPPGSELELPSGPARHVQVRRAQPGDAVRLFDGVGGEWSAVIVSMGRQAVHVRIGEPVVPAAELPVRVTLAVGVPTNERMDALVEKATELGVAAIRPLMCERSVLRLTDDRAERKRVHWQAIAVAAAEQSGRATVPVIEPVLRLDQWLTGELPAGARLLLSLAPQATPLRTLLAGVSGRADSAVVALSGPEGGLSPAEQDTALLNGFVPASLGPRVLRADTAPLAVLAWIGLRG